MVFYNTFKLSFMFSIILLKKKKKQKITRRRFYTKKILTNLRLKNRTPQRNIHT